MSGMAKPGAKRRPVIEWSVAHRAKSGAARSGDLHLVRPTPKGLLLAVVDGLGHGEEAALAAGRAVEVLDRHGDEPVTEILKRCHEALRPTRGVVISVAEYNEALGRLTWLGVGNVEGVLLRARQGAANGRERLLLRGGVVGARLPDLREETMPVAEGDLLIFVTDGVESPFDASPKGGSARDIADRILAQYGKASDDALVLVARFLREDR